LRARIRPAFEASPNCDEKGFTQNLETIFKGLAQTTYDRFNLKADQA